MELAAHIEGVLFHKATAVSKDSLATLFSVPITEIEEALQKLQHNLQNRGIALVVTATEAQLVTHPDLDQHIETMRRDELKRDIGKAGAETLAIILYKEPITRAEIDRIRGVNSSFILRNLLSRGLIAKDDTKQSTHYRITTALLMHLGITEKSQLPQYSSVLDTLEQFEEEVTQSDT